MADAQGTIDQANSDFMRGVTLVLGAYTQLLDAKAPVRHPPAVVQTFLLPS